MAAWVSGFAQETDADYWRTLRQITAYDPDQIQGLYATPHRWTVFGAQQAGRRVIQTDLRRWDYKHHVLESKHVPDWRVLLWVKLIEAVAQLRPKSVWRLSTSPRLSSGRRCDGITESDGGFGRMNCGIGSSRTAAPAMGRQSRDFGRTKITPGLPPPPLGLSRRENPRRTLENKRSPFVVWLLGVDYGDD